MDARIYCHSCSGARGGDKPVYHKAPACPPSPDLNFHFVGEPADLPERRGLPRVFLCYVEGPEAHAFRDWWREDGAELEFVDWLSRRTKGGVY